VDRSPALLATLWDGQVLGLRLLEDQTLQSLGLLSQREAPLRIKTGTITLCDKVRVRIRDRFKKSPKGALSVGIRHLLSILGVARGQTPCKREALTK